MNFKQIFAYVISFLLLGAAYEALIDFEMTSNPIGLDSCNPSYWLVVILIIGLFIIISFIAYFILRYYLRKKEEKWQSHMKNKKAS